MDEFFGAEAARKTVQEAMVCAQPAPSATFNPAPVVVGPRSPELSRLDLECHDPHGFPV